MLTTVDGLKLKLLHLLATASISVADLNGAKETVDVD
jgi:hypothetical protein